MYYLIRADDIALEKADELYEAGKRGEAAVVYRRYPRQLLRPDSSGARYLRRLIEHEVGKGDQAAWPLVLGIAHPRIDREGFHLLGGIR